MKPSSIHSVSGKILRLDKLKAVHVLLLHVVLFSLACGTGKFAVEEKHGRLLYTSPDKQLQLTFYGDYVFYKPTIKNISKKAPALYDLQSGSSPFVIAITKVSPWIQCIGFSMNLQSETGIDSAFVSKYLPDSATLTALTPYRSDINGSKGMKVAYITQSGKTAILEYFTQIEEKLIRVSFSTPDSSALNMEAEAGWIYKSLQLYSPDTH